MHVYAKGLGTLFGKFRQANVCDGCDMYVYIYIYSNIYIYICTCAHFCTLANMYKKIIPSSKIGIDGEFHV